MRRPAIRALLAIALCLMLASPALAAKKKKEAKSIDPYKGRVALGLRVGGGFGGGGSAFVGQLSVTYWFVQYFSMTAASGYGFYTAYYEDYKGDEQTANVNYIPSELLATIYPMPRAKFSPYLGGGVGLDYIWFTLEDFEAKGEDKSESASIYSGIGRAGFISRIAPNVSLSLGARYTHPLNTPDDFEDQGGYFSFEGGLLMTF